MHSHYMLGFCALVSLFAWAPGRAATSQLPAATAAQTPVPTTHQAVPISSSGERFIPDISVIANLLANFTDNHADDNRGKVRVKEAELAFQGYVYPGVHADLIAALEQEYDPNGSSTETDLEEASLSFLELPCDLQARVGRQLIAFGKLNPLHPHHWPFADRPLVYQNFFGEHNWYDDGVNVNTLIPNPWDLYWKVSAGVFNGRHLGHAHAHETQTHAEPIEWQGRVYAGRTSVNVPFARSDDLDLGYSLACDSGRDTLLHAVDLTVTHRWANSYRRLTWQTEYLYTEVDHNSLYRGGLYSMLLLTLDKYWQIGTRYDWSEALEAGQEEEWALTPFITRFFNESFYARAQYRYRRMLDDHAAENTLFLQLVWGMGPHSHRLED